MEKIKKSALKVTVIVFLVMLATYFENVKQKRDKEETVKEFLQGLKVDLLNDISEMENDQKSFQLTKSGIGYFASVSEKKFETTSLEKNIYLS